MTAEERDRYIADIIRRRLESPKSYALDGESITNDTPEELAKLVRMLQQTAAEDAPASPRAPFRVSVCDQNSTVL